MESSGYNECMKQVDQREIDWKQCIKDKLSDAGYEDTIECLADYTNPICEDLERYDAEVNAHNDCIGILKDSSALTSMDCLELLNE